MSSPLRILIPRRGLPVWCVAAVLLAGAPLVGVFVAGCHEGRHDLSARAGPRVYPPAPYVPRVVALGTLRGQPPPTKRQVDLSMFLFGVEPPPSLVVVNPTGLAGSDDCVLICDHMLSGVFQWASGASKLSELRFRPALDHPFSVDIAPNGDHLVCARGIVARAGTDGEVYVRYALASEPFKPADVLAVGDAVWVTNLAAHRIEVFDAGTAEHLRSIGEQGSGPGQFQMPRGLARTPDGNVCVVDMLNNRVQVLDTQGSWIRDIGAPGSGPCAFGRPKDVAVGPDGAVFVTDALTQRVHVFAASGEPLLAFGELTLPNGIAVTSLAPRAEHELPAGMSPAYHVLVAEQLNRPGVRVYAWLGGPGTDVAAAVPLARPIVARVGVPEGPAGPHWDPESCAACHEEGDDEELLPIDLEDVAELCMDCHEGHDEGPFVHTVDGDAEAEELRVPSDWPVADGELTCLTCHQIRQQCSLQARRAAASPKMLRRYNPWRSRNFCAACHADVPPGWGESPHRQLDVDGQPDTDSCLLCHELAPEIPSNGVRKGAAQLRAASDLCLRCHARHWDYYPANHVNQLVPRAMRERTRFPLADGRIACYTCHNPHQPGLLPSGSELGMCASSPADAAHYLRAGRPELCLGCHDK